MHPKENAYLPYPLFHYVVLTASYLPYLGYEYLAGHFRPEATYPYGMSDPVGMCAALTLIARAVSVLMAAGTVWLLYRIARLIEVGRGAAAGMAAAVALMPPFLYYGRAANLDVPYVFWTVAALQAAAGILFDGRFGRGAFIRFGVFAALAVATKDQAYAFLIAVPPLLLVAIANGPCRDLPTRARLWASVFYKPLWLGLLTSVAAFALANNVILGWSGFLGHIDQTLQYSTIERKWASDAAGQLGLLGDTLEQLALTVGPLGLLSVFGVVHLARERRWLLLTFLILPPLLHQLLVLGKIGYTYPRFVILPAMFVMLLAACALPPRRRRAVAAVREHHRRRSGWRTSRSPPSTSPAASCSTRGTTREEFFDARAEPGQTVETYARFARLAPRLPDGVRLSLVPLTDIEASKLAARRPDFILVTDLSDVGVYERSEPTPFGAALLGGRLGYRVAFDRRSPSLLGRRFVRCVAPRVTILQREPLPQ